MILLTIGIQNQSNIIAPDTVYLNGDIKDDPNGTAVNRQVYGDIHQFFAKLLRDAGITPNTLRDNETNGYQLMGALLQRTAPRFIWETTSDFDGDVQTITRAQINTAATAAGLGLTAFDKGIPIDGATPDELRDFTINVMFQINGTGNWFTAIVGEGTNAQVKVQVNNTSGDIQLTFDMAPSSNSNVRVILT